MLQRATRAMLPGGAEALKTPHEDSLSYSRVFTMLLLASIGMHPYTAGHSKLVPIANARNELLSTSLQPSRSSRSSQPSQNMVLASNDGETLGNSAFGDPGQTSSPLAVDVEEPKELHHTFSADGYLETLEKYCELMSGAEEELLSELRRSTEEVAPRAIRMLSSHLQGRILSLLVRLRKPQKVLELGTFSGYATLSMAASLPDDGKVVTCELDPRLASTAKSFFERSAHSSKLELRVQNASEALEELRRAGEVFDFVFIDADKKNYVNYLKTLLGIDQPSQPMVSEDAIIVVDNVLWKGLVLENVPDLRDAAPDPAKFGAATRMKKLADAMHEFNTYVSESPMLEQIMLPLRDGLSIIRVRSKSA